MNTSNIAFDYEQKENEITDYSLACIMYKDDDDIKELVTVLNESELVIFKN